MPLIINNNVPGSFSRGFTAANTAVRGKQQQEATNQQNAITGTQGRFTTGLDLLKQAKRDGLPITPAMIETVRRPGVSLNGALEAAGRGGIDVDAQIQLAISGTANPEQAGTAEGTRAGASIEAQTPAEVERQKALIPVKIEEHKATSAPQETFTLKTGEELGIPGAEGVVYAVNDLTSQPTQLFAPPKPGMKQAFDRTTGQPVFVSEQDIAANPDRYQPILSGMKMLMGENGAFEFSSGPGTGQMGTATVNTIEDNLLKVGDRLTRVNKIMDSVRPEFLQLPGKANKEWLAFKEWVGGDLSEEDKQYLGDFAEFKQNAYRDLNAVLHEMSGAAINPQEAERLTKELSDPEGDSPTEFYRKLQNTQRYLVLAQARLNYILKSGKFDITAHDMNTLFTQAGDIETFGNTMKEEARKIEAEIRAEKRGASDDEVERELAKRVGTLFGLVY